MTTGEQNPAGASPAPPPFGGGSTPTQWWDPGAQTETPQEATPDPVPGPAPRPAEPVAAQPTAVTPPVSPARPSPTPPANLSPRQRRLNADAQELLSGFSGHPNIAVHPVGAQPPERYQIIYALPALVTNQFNSLQVTNQHVVHMILPAGYPREKPYCTCDSTVFHPNFGSYICIADFWSPSQSIVDVVVQIGDMLQYKLYNVRSPLNAVAARWVSQHLDRVPISSVNLQPQVAEVHLGGSERAQQ